MSVPQAPPAAIPVAPGSYIDNADKLYEQGKDAFTAGDYTKAQSIMIEVEKLAGGPYRNSSHYIEESKPREGEAAQACACYCALLCTLL